MGAAGELWNHWMSSYSMVPVFFLPKLIFRDLMKKSKILVVEDDFDTQLFLRLFLGKYYEVDICKSDADCYESLRQKWYHLIIMDIAIKGGKDGLQITKELKNDDQYKDIPILCLSAHVLDKDKRSAYEAGVDIFLEKPVRNDNLLNTINKLILR